MSEGRTEAGRAMLLPLLRDNALAGDVRRAVLAIEAEVREGLIQELRDLATGWNASGRPGDASALMLGLRLLQAPDPLEGREPDIPMPPALPGETDEQYTDRLTGADGTERVPYTEHRNRQCSIGYHDECSESADRHPELTSETRGCKCPCHADPLEGRTDE